MASVAWLQGHTGRVGQACTVKERVIQKRQRQGIIRGDAIRVHPRPPTQQHGRTLEPSMANRGPRMCPRKQGTSRTQHSRVSIARTRAHQSRQATLLRSGVILARGTGLTIASRTRGPPARLSMRRAAAAPQPDEVPAYLARKREWNPLRRSMTSPMSSSLGRKVIR